MDELTFRRAFEGWHLYDCRYGSVSAVSALFHRTAENVYIGVGLNIGFEGNYQLRLKGNSTLLLIKKYDCNYVLKRIELDKTDITIEGDSLTLKLVCDKGNLTGYLNGAPLICFDDSNDFAFSKGYGGVWIHPESSADFTTFNIEGDFEEAPSKACKKIIKRYSANFDDINTAGMPKGWYCKPYTPRFVLKNGWFSAETKEYSEAILHLFSRNLTLNFKFKISQINGDGQFGFFLRKSPDTAFLKCRFDVSEKSWILEDTPALYDCKTQCYKSGTFEIFPEKEYSVCATAQENFFELKIDGISILNIKNLRHANYGKVSLFSENAEFSVKEIFLDAENATEAAEDIVQYVIETPDSPAASMQIIENNEGNLLGIRKILSEKQLLGTGSEKPIDFQNPESRGIFFSKDRGASFTDLPLGGEYAGLCTNGAYQSVIRLKNGKYIQVLLNNRLEVQESFDLKEWKTLSHIISEEDYPENGVIFHTQSLSEYTLPNGVNRIFIPIVEKHTVPIDALGAEKNGHNTVVYYSDDGGASWIRSKTDTDEIIDHCGEKTPINDIAECKIVFCGDNSMRLYCTRSESRFLCYFESFDFGETWQNIKCIRYMQCGKSSFSVYEDRFDSGTYYLVWVNSLPLSRGNTSERTRLSLAKSTDGKNWDFLCDIERMGLCFPDKMTRLRSPLFQLVDPAVYVTKEYVFVTNGTVLFSAKKEVLPGSALAVHHEQRTLVTRIKKSCLKKQDWDSTTICDISLLEEEGVWL